ncbi:MAG: hypothetical protein WC827_01695 [Candidatus Paceibacterota bacterium]|jgi:hypothetical protein
MDINQNNINGNNNVYLGPQPRKLDSSLETQLKQLIPTGSSVNVTSVLGDGEAYNFASQIKEYLDRNNYKVNGVNQAVYSQPINGQIIENPKDDSDSFKIIIGNKQ